MALLHAARASAAQRRLVASAAQQERDARAAAAQRSLWRQQSRLEKDKVLLQAARAAAARRRLVVAAAQQDAPRTPSSRKQHPPPRVEVSNAYWTRCLNHQYEDALAAPIPPRLATLITQLDKAAA
jgi:hypothetical protein